MVTKFERRITTQLKTWLTAVGIGFEDSTSGLVVTSKDGAKVPVAVAVKGKPAPALGAISVQGKDLTSRNLRKSLEAFGKLQVALGYPPRAPVDRGPIPTHKAHYADDFELVALRHSDFRRSPNPTAAEMKAFETVVNKAAWWFYRKNNQTCLDHGMEVDDLRSYAQAWTVNYLGLYKDDTLTRVDNERYLFQYLSQRFVEFREQLDKKGRNILPMLDDAYIAMHGRPYEYTNKGDWFSTDPEGDSTWEIPGGAESEAAVVTGAQRERTKRDSIATLNARLGELGHDEMVEVLSGAVSNDRIHLDARRAASRKLQVHAKTCKGCSDATFPRAPGDGSVPNGLPIEDEKGQVFSSAKDAASAHGVYPSNVRAVLAGRYRHTGGHTFKYVAAGG